MPKCFSGSTKQHRENIHKLANYIQDIGGQPKENLRHEGNDGRD